MKPKLPALLLLLVAALLVAACTPNPVAPAPAAVTTEPASTPLAQPAPAQPAADPLPSWNEGPTKTAILKFIADVTDPNGSKFVLPADRIAVFDNDGTLWTEMPILPQAAFVFARIQAMAKDHPDWATTQPYAAILSGDEEAIKAFTPEQIEELIYTTHAGMSPEEFESLAKDFLATAMHPQFKVPYTQTVYQPLLELLDLLRANDFRPFIVSGGGADFVRAFAPDVYGIPTDDVVGSSLQYEFKQTSPITGDLVRLPEMVTFDDKAMKPVNIQRNIGKRPVMAIGNSDGDLAMFQYTGGGKLPFLNLLIVHDDAEREYEYTWGAEAVRTAAAQSPWLFVSMKRDFKTVFPPGVPAAEMQASNAGWSTYTNPASFSIQYPPTWKQAELPPTATAQGVSLDGPEGAVELWWGTGFGGACPEGYSTVKVADGELPACHTVGADGIQHWEQINKELTTTSFSGRAYTKDAAQASADAVLAVLATLSFEQGPAAPAPADASAATAAQAGQPATAQLTADPGLTAPVTGGTPLKDALPSMTPQDVWQNFYKITQIPRPSGHMDQIRAFLVDFGKGLNLETTVDEAGNVLIRKPASKGMENRAGVVLQAHMDMVGQAAPGTTFDFTTQPIEAYVAGDWVHADNTTLGADNGVGIAIIMALLQRTDLVAPSIEALFTVDEESTMSGANDLGADELDGKDYVNVDTESEGEFFIGSAGGLAMQNVLAYQTGGGPQSAATGFHTVTVTGLTGGHSGVDIDKGRGSAIKLLVRLLRSAGEWYGVRVASLQGGTYRNAIPSEANALIMLPVENNQTFGDYLKKSETTFRTELAATEPKLAVEWITSTVSGPAPAVMTLSSQNKVLDVLYVNPQGVLRMSDTVPGLVETSNNLGVVTTANGLVTASNLSRSSVDSELTDAGEMVMSAWDLAGGQSSVADRYPPWTPNPDSPLLNLFMQTYEQLYQDKTPTYTAVHAGLECGTVASKYPEMDFISLGPTLIDVHSASERLQVSTVPRVVDLLAAVLGQIPSQ